jgi:hypothetical protein
MGQPSMHKIQAGHRSQQVNWFFRNIGAWDNTFRWKQDWWRPPACYTTLGTHIPPSSAPESIAPAEAPIYVNEVFHHLDDTPFSAAWSKELDALMKREWFETVDKASVPPGINVME